MKDCVFKKDSKCFGIEGLMLVAAPTCTGDAVLVLCDYHAKNYYRK